MIRRIYFCFILFVFVFTLVPQSNNSFLSNDKIYTITDPDLFDWSFKADDQLLYFSRDYTSHDWDKMTPYNSWQVNDTSLKDYHGPSWYRLIFDFKATDSEKSLGLLIPYSYGSYQIYINDELFFESNDFEALDENRRKTSKPLLLEVPVRLLNDSKNLIAFRVSSMDAWGGFAANLHAGSYNQLQVKWTISIIRQNGIAFTCLFFAIFYFIHFLMRRNEKYYLWFSAMILSMGAFIFGFFGFCIYFFDAYWSYVLFTFIGGMQMYLWTLKFIHSFLKRKIGKVGWGVIFLYSFQLLFLTFEFIFTGGIFFSKYYLYQFMLLTHVIAITYLIVVNIKAIKQKTPFALLLFSGVSVQFATFLYSSLAYANIIRLDPLTSEGYLAVIIAFAVILAKRSANTQIQLEIAHDNLTVLDKLKDDFLANTSHELRTPLNGIIGLAESLVDQVGQPIGQVEKESLSLIVSSGRRLSNLVNDILDFSKLKNKDLEIRQNPVGMRSVANVVLNLSAHLAKKKDLEFINDISEDIPTVLGDENRLQQILYNLVGNAIKFTDEGEIRISAREEGGFVYISVKDTGIGIPPQKFGDIFNSFEQVDNSSSRKYTGTGIGLAITRQLVKLHGGVIEVDSVLGQGSTFTFSIPVSGDEAIDLDDSFSELAVIQDDFDYEEQAAEDDGAHDETDYRVLVVDDEAINRRVYTSQLAGQNYHIKQASTGMEALEIVDGGFRPDVVLLDIMMPKMTGFEVMEKLRETFPSYKLPIIMVTAKNRINDLVYAFDSGANDYIAKPFTKKELVTRVKTHLAMKKISDENHDLLDNLEDKVNVRTAELTEKNAQIMDSITYASAIQHSILPRREVLEENLREYFVIWKPQNIVGGDFHWFHKTDKGYFLGIMDCTGHGVPGAFMTMTVHSVLNRIISHVVKDDPAAILEEINRSIRYLLNQDREDALSDDGLDMGLCYYDQEANRVLYAGAKHTLRVLRKGELTYIKGNKQSLGYFRSKEDYKYENHEIRLQGDEAFYLTSDGYVDQNGGDRDFSFGNKRFDEIILEQGSLHMMEQKARFEEALSVYQGSRPQRDDILVLGFKI